MARMPKVASEKLFGMQHSLLSQFFFPSQPCYIIKNIYVKRRDYMDYNCYQMVDDAASEYSFSYKSEVVRSYWLTK
jgi:hypothetical protein